MSVRHRSTSIVKSCLFASRRGKLRYSGFSRYMTQKFGPAKAQVHIFPLNAYNILRKLWIVPFFLLVKEENDNPKYIILLSVASCKGNFAVTYAKISRSCVLAYKFNSLKPILLLGVPLILKCNILRSAHLLHLSSVYESKNKQQLFTYTHLTGWFL